MRFDISLQNFNEPLVDIFSPQIERKNGPKNIIRGYNFGCRKKALSNFLGSSSSLKTANTGKPAQNRSCISFCTSSVKRQLKTSQVDTKLCQIQLLKFDQ